MDFVVSSATGTAERDAVAVMLDDARQRGFRPRTLGGDRGYDTRQCVKDMRDRGVTPHVAQRTHSAVDGRTTRHPSYGVSQKIRKRVEEIFGWMKFLDSMRRRFPFPIKAVQVDGGSEFQAAFETACRELGIRLFVLPLRSPKLNGHVERAQRTHTEEFYELYDGELEVAPLNRALLNWERLYDTFRPHHSLDGRTPAEYLEQCHPSLVSSPLSHMY